MNQSSILVSSDVAFLRLSSKVVSEQYIFVSSANDRRFNYVELDVSLI